MERKPNRLINEKSPYLLQHAYNPVAWHPWDDKAFEKALKENKPIFLSVGYSTCHWCHVMEQESFEDDEVARLMNETFISIKVDREERPDLDHIYMTVCQMLTGNGGWPLTIIMTPDKKPFFAGTYIPRNSRFGRKGMVELIPNIQQVWTTRYDEVIESAEKIIAALQGMDALKPGADIDDSILDKAYNELANRFDSESGGFGPAPKFPTPHNYLFLLRYWRRTGNQTALNMVEKSLQEMRRGGIFDHLGFGFHRYSTDKEWLVPHFEKMLYDQALLAIAYLEAYQATGKENYSNTAREIFTYVLRDMTSPEGGFYSAEDADSEGEEGKYYVWKEKEVIDILGKKASDLIFNVFNIERNGNYKDESSERYTGANIFHLKKSIPQIAVELQITPDTLRKEISSATEKLFEKRKERVRPQKDDKILTDWNGLMIAALARGAQILEDHKYLDAAIKAVDFIMDHMCGSNNQLLHRYRDGEGGITANLDDYAFMVWGLIDLYEASFNPIYLKKALELNQIMLSLFLDTEKGGLFFAPDNSNDLIIRKKEIYDRAVPSGNSVAMLNMLKLARFSGRADLEDTAARIGRAFISAVEQMPSAHTHLMMAVDFGMGPAYEVSIAGKSDSFDTQEMIRAIHRKFIPNKVILLRPAEEDAPAIDDLAEFVKHHVSIDNKATAYVCINNSCKAPTIEVNKMLESIEGSIHKSQH